MTFWKHWVRTPALVVLSLSLLLGATGSLDWAPALAAAAVAAMTARAANSRAKHQAKEAETATILEFPASRGQGRRYDRAA